MSTVQDALLWLESMLAKPFVLDGAKQQAVWRDAFLTLLPRKLQRRVFLNVAKDFRKWPSLRGLFGAPPFWFLDSEDADCLRAGGLAHRRVNMAYATPPFPVLVPTSQQFGSGHFVDEMKWRYNLLAREGLGEETTPVALPTFEMLRGRVVLLMYRRGGNGLTSSASFLSVTEVRLRTTPFMKRYTTSDSSMCARLRVMTMQPLGSSRRLAVVTAHVIGVEPLIDGSEMSSDEGPPPR